MNEKNKALLFNMSKTKTTFIDRKDKPLKIIKNLKSSVNNLDAKKTYSKMAIQKTFTNTHGLLDSEFCFT